MEAASLSDALFAGFAVTAWTPAVGELVGNFGHVGRVLEVDPARGVRLRLLPGQGADGSEWYADPKLCRPAR